MRFYLVPVALFTAMAALPLGCGSKSGVATWPEKPGAKVVTMFAPLQSFAANVMGDKGTARCLLNSEGPHDYKASPNDGKIIEGADLVFSSGLNLDNSIIKAMKQGTKNTKVKYVELGAALDEKKLLEGEHNHDHAPGEKHDHKHDHGFDPHVWLAPEYAMQYVTKIRDELKAADAAHAVDYDRNAEAYLAKLTKLKADGVVMLNGKTERSFVTMHDSLGYFARSFDLKIAGVIQLTPGQDPTAKQMNELIEACVKGKVRVIAVEPQYPTNAVAAIKRELKAKGIDAEVIELDPMETAPAEEINAELYEKVMRKNLETLAKALK